MADSDPDPNPNPGRITDEMWWLWLQLQALEPDTELGGIYANKRGYHNTGAANEANWPGDYSIRDPQDRRGAHWRDRAAAIDWTFPDAQGGDYRRIAKYHARLMAAGRAGDPRLAGWREALGQADQDGEVEGFDFRHHFARSADESHLWHIHLSETREWVDSKVNKEALLSVLIGESLAAYLARGGRLINGKGPDMFFLKAKGDPAIYISNGVSSRPVPGGLWDSMCVPLINRGALLLELGTRDEVLRAGGPLLPELDAIRAAASAGAEQGVAKGADELAAALAPLLDLDEAAVKAALREVLGGARIVVPAE